MFKYNGNRKDLKEATDKANEIEINVYKKIKKRGTDFIGDSIKEHISYVFVLNKLDDWYLNKEMEIEDYKILHKKSVSNYVSKVCEELSELQTAFLHSLDEKCSIHDVAKELADVLVQMDKIIALISKFDSKKQEHINNIVKEYYSDGQTYYEFRRDQHVKEFDVKPGTKFIISDFNVDPHCSLACQFVDGQIQVIEEFFLRNSDTPKAVSEWSKSYRGASVIPDSTGKNRKISGQSDFDIIKDAGFTIESTYNPFVKDRVNNVNKCLKDGRILIHPRCKKLINDLEKVVRTI